MDMRSRLAGCRSARVAELGNLGRRITAGAGWVMAGRWPQRRAVAGAVAAGASVLLIGGGAAPAAAGVRAGSVRVHWGLAEEVPGLGALNAGGNAQVVSLSCWRPGDCAAIAGMYVSAVSPLKPTLPSTARH
jgi:hypothetical protein